MFFFPFVDFCIMGNGKCVCVYVHLSMYVQCAVGGFGFRLKLWPQPREKDNWLGPGGVKVWPKDFLFFEMTMGLWAMELCSCECHVPSHPMCCCMLYTVWQPNRIFLETKEEERAQNSKKKVTRLELKLDRTESSAVACTNISFCQ